MYLPAFINTPLIFSQQIGFQRLNAQLLEKGHDEGGYSAKDIRYTCKGNTVYVMVKAGNMKFKDVTM
jgi:hypothetical protein